MPRDGSNIWSPPAGTTATPSTAIESAKYNALVADITADLNAPRPIVAGGTGATTAGAALTALGGQPLDAGLTSIAGLTTAADRMIYTTAADTYAVATLTAAGRALLDDADAAAQRTTLGAQASDATLTSLSGLSLVAGDILYATAADTLVRLPKGTAGQALVMNSGATAPEWVAGGFQCRAWVNFNGVATNGTYTRTGNTVTVTMTGHGMTTGMIAGLDFTSGAATDGSYAVTVTDANTFTITDPASGATSGNVTRNTFIRASGNVSSITDNGTGDYTINFTTPLVDANYCVNFGGAGFSLTNISQAVVVAGTAAGGPTLKTTAQLRVQSGSSTNGSLLDTSEINVAIFR